MRIALYARVSTIDKGQDPRLQILELRDYCYAQKWFDPSRDNLDEYIEHKSAVKRRPVLQQLMQDAVAGKVQVVVVWKLDRFCRSLVDFVNNVQQLADCGVRFIATTQGIDTEGSNAIARFLMHILALMAELERELTRERVAAGMAHAKRKGTKLGRKLSTWDVGKAVDLQEKGWSLREICAAMTYENAKGRIVHPSPPTVLERIRKYKTRNTDGQTNIDQTTGAAIEP